MTAASQEGTKSMAGRGAVLSAWAQKTKEQQTDTHQCLPKGTVPVGKTRDDFNKLHSPTNSKDRNTYTSKNPQFLSVRPEKSVLNSQALQEENKLCLDTCFNANNSLPAFFYTQHLCGDFINKPEDIESRHQVADKINPYAVLLSY